MKVNVYRKLPQRPTLREGQIDVWCWQIDQLALFHYEWETLLSWGERQRANRFRQSKQKHNYILTRGMVRYLLSRYLQQALETVQLTTDVNDTLHPYDGEMCIDAAYTEDAIMIAVAKNLHLGVQIEAIDRLPDLDALAKFMLNSAEIRPYSKLRRHNKLATFYDLWTRKSAVCKAAQTSLIHFDQLNVWKENTRHTVAPNAVVSVQSLNLLPRYSGAIAFQRATT